MAEIKKTISQIQIGNNTYNIKDAEVREVLGNVTDNFVALNVTYYADWGAVKPLQTNTQLKNASQDATLINRLSTGISISTSGLLRWRHAVFENNKIEWASEPIIAGMPEKVSQCGIILQYRTRVTMPIRGQVTSAIYRLYTGNNDLTEAESAFEPTQEAGYKIQNTTAHTCTKSLNGGATLHCSTSWYDRIVRSDTGRSGYDFKPGIRDYVQGESITDANRAKTAGGALRILFIVQGTSTKALIPIEDEIIEDIEPPVEGEEEGGEG